MGQNVPLAHGDVAITPFFAKVQEMLSGAAPSLNLNLLNSTTVQVVAGSGDAQMSVSIGGRYRYRTSNTSAVHPGGAAGTYNVWVTASDNNFVLGSTTVDNTSYDFGLSILSSAAFPGTPLYRKVGEVDWDGTQITSLRNLAASRRDNAPIVPTAPLASITPLRARGAAGQSAALATFENSAGAALASITAAGGLILSDVLSAPGPLTKTVVLTTNGQSVPAGALAVVSTPGIGVTLPTPKAGVMVAVVAVGTSITGDAPVTVNPSGGASINAPGLDLLSYNSARLGARNAFIVLLSDGTDWYCVAGGQDTGWITLAGIPGSTVPTTTNGSFAFQGRLQGDRVRLRGQLQNTSGGNLAPSFVVANVNATYMRPANTVRLPAFMYSGLGQTAVQVEVTSGGGILVDAGLASGAILPLDSITYPLR